MVAVVNYNDDEQVGPWFATRQLRLTTRDTTQHPQGQLIWFISHDNDDGDDGDDDDLKHHQ